MRANRIPNEGPGRERKPLKMNLGTSIFACLALYAIDSLTLACTANEASAYVTNFALPFDLMFCIPLVFYLTGIRGRSITPIAILPLVYIGGIISIAVVEPNEPTILPALFLAAFALDAAILSKELPKIARRMKQGYTKGKSESPYPIDWFEAAFVSVTHNRTAARLAAMEATMWYWLVPGKKKVAQPKKTPFTYHENSSLTTLSCTIVALGVVEAAAVHILVSQFSPTIATVLTIVSAYTLSWLLANAKAATRSPIWIGHENIDLAWGAFLRVHIPRISVEAISHEDPGFAKSQILDFSCMGGKDSWLVLNGAMTVETLLGKPKTVKAFKISPDQPEMLERRLFG